MVSRTPSNRNSAAGTHATVNVRDVFRILFRHKRKMAAFCSATMTLVILGLIFIPKSYTSDARLFLRLGRESIGLDPTAAMSQTVNLAESRESEINSEIEILRSRVLLEDVVKRLGADYVVHAGGPAKENGWMATLTAPLAVARTWLNGVVSQDERAVERLEKAITVTAPRRSSVILVKCKGFTPGHAQKMLQTFLDAYAERHVQANRTEGSHDFFVDQSELLRDQLRKASEELRDARNATSLVSIEGQRENVQNQASTIEAAILENERALASSEAMIAAHNKSLNELPEQLGEQTAGLPNAAADGMRGELYRLQIQEKELSSRFTSLHPHVIAIRRQVSETQKILDEQEPSRSQTTRRPSIVHQHVQTELATANATAASQRALANSLKKQYEGVLSKIRALNDDEVRITEMTRKVELLEVSYRSYVRNREEARIDQQLASGRISNVNLVQPASFVAKPSSPRVMLTLAMGMFLALCGSVALAFAAEFLDRSLKTQNQIENELGVPVLFSVPRGSGHELLHN